jgi:nucleoside-diphosphate-sugar epimerase
MIAMPERLLIVGGTGFIGRTLALKASAIGFRTTVLSLNLPSSEERITGVEYLQSDVRDESKLRKNLSHRSFEFIVNLSGYINHLPFFKGGDKIIESHFYGVNNLLKTIDRSTLKRFVQIGSSDEYGTKSAPQNENMRESPISPYSFSKLASTNLLQMLHQTEELPVVILRLFLVYGPGQAQNRFLPQIIHGCLSGNHFPTSTGEQIRDFCYIEDIIHGVILSFTNNKINGEVINLASGQPTKVCEVIEMVRNIISRGTPDYGIIPFRESENMRIYADITKTKELLKWKARTKLEDGIIKTIESYR